MNEHQHRKLIFALGAFVTFVFTFFRFQNIPGVFTKLGVVVADTAPYYRLHRIEQVVLGDWIYPLFERKMDFPGGWDVAWPMGMDYFFAIPLKLFGVTNPTNIMVISCLMLPILAYPLLFMTVSVTTSYSNKVIGWLSGLFLACLPTIIYQTGIGRIDHQFLEAVFAVFNLYAFLKVKRENTKFSRALFIACVGLSSAVFPHGWFSCLFLNLALLSESNVEVLKTTSRLLLKSFILSLIPLALTSRFSNGYVSIAGFSWWGSLIVISSAAFVHLLACLRARKLKFTTNDSMIWLCLALTFGFLLYKNPHFFMREASMGTSWLVEKKGTLGTMYESRKLFDMPWSELGDGRIFYLMPLIYVWFAAQKKHVFLLLYSLIPVGFVLIQVRFLTAAYPFMTMLILLFLWDLAKKISSVDTKRWSAVAVLVLALIAWNRPVLGFTHYNTHDSVFYSVRAAGWFMKEQTAQRKLQPLETGIIAAWDYGDWLLYYSGLPIVASSFQSHQALETDQLFASETWADFEAYEKKYPGTFILIEQALPRYWTNLSNMDKNPNEYFAKPEGKQSLAPLKKFENVFYYRFLERLGADDQENFPDHWRLAYVSPYVSENSSGLPGVKVFEKVPGAVIQMQRPEQNLWLQIKVRQKDGRAYVIRKKSTVMSGQTHQWTVPYAAYDRGQVFCDGIYSLVDEQGKIIQQLPVVTENQVLQGTLIK